MASLSLALSIERGRDLTMGGDRLISCGRPSYLLSMTLHANSFPVALSMHRCTVDVLPTPVYYQSENEGLYEILWEYIRR